MNCRCAFGTPAAAIKVFLNDGDEEADFMIQVIHKPQTLFRTCASLCSAPTGIAAIYTRKHLMVLCHDRAYRPAELQGGCSGSVCMCTTGGD